MSEPDVFVVESRVDVKDDAGNVVKQGTARVWVASQARAEQIVAEGPKGERSWRRASLDEMRPDVRENLLRAHAAA